VEVEVEVEDDEDAEVENTEVINDRKLLHTEPLWPKRKPVEPGVFLSSGEVAVCTTAWIG
jgi:hypothetical protein